MIEQDVTGEIRRRQSTNLFGELKPLLPFLENKSLTDIFCYGNGKIKIVDFIEGTKEADLMLSEESRFRIINYLASMNGIAIDFWREPTLETTIPGYNARFTGVLPPWVDKPEFTIRRPPADIFTLEQYVESGRISKDNYDILIQSIKNKDNILVGGGTGSGKTTFINSVMDKMVEFSPEDRFLIIEDTPELQIRSENATILKIRKDQATSAVQFALRWTPKRVIFGETRSGAVAVEIKDSWNTGHPGNLTSIHANSARSMVSRFNSLLAQEIKGTLPDISDYIQICVHLVNKPGFGAFVDEILPTKELKKHEATNY